MAVGKERKKGKGEGEKEGAHTEAAAAHSGGGDKRSNRGAGVPLAGTDDAGNFYASHEQLMDVQESNKAAWYEANKVTQQRSSNLFPISQQVLCLDTVLSKRRNGGLADMEGQRTRQR